MARRQAPMRSARGTAGIWRRETSLGREIRPPSSAPRRGAVPERIQDSWAAAAVEAGARSGPCTRARADRRGRRDALVAGTAAELVDIK